MNTRKDLSSRLARIQDALGNARGKKYWRTLEELAESDEFRELMRQEFPDQADIWPSSLDRRRFLTLMGASLALGGLAGCSAKPAPTFEIVPYVNQPEDIVPGKPLFYATAMTLGGAAVGLLVENHLGRPTKIEGNPDHPASLGATDAHHQASILSFYDPDRSETVTVLGITSTWDAALGPVAVNGVPSIRLAIEARRANRGAGLRLLTETVVSPTLHDQIQSFLKAFPEARWHQYEALAPVANRRAARVAYGESVHTIFDFKKADVVVSLDADFLAGMPGSLRYAADFMAGRRVRTAADKSSARQAKMNRLYVIEPSVTCTGAKADHRLPLRPEEIERFARGLAARLGILKSEQRRSEITAKWIDAIAKDLEGHRGRSIVIAGDRQPEAVHLLAHAINHHLGNVGATVIHTEPVAAQPIDELESLRELVNEMGRGQVEMLVILGGNPVYDAPADFQFGERLQKIKMAVHLSQFQDETSRLCHWHLPEAHFLESWGDTRAYDGTATIVQPLMTPLYQGRTAIELLSGLTYPSLSPGLQIVRSYWAKRHGDAKQPGDFETFWQTALHDGIVPETQAQPKSVSLQPKWADALKEQGRVDDSSRERTYSIAFEPDPTVYDGRFANNGWLQECPKPITNLTWDNAVYMSAATALELGVWNGGLPGEYAHGGEHGGFHVPIVEIRLGERFIQGPVWIVPGHVDGTVTVSLGYGRTYAGRVGGLPDSPCGFNAYLLRTSDHMGFARGATIRKMPGTHSLACTQQHQLMENREVVRAATLDEYRRHPRFAQEHEREFAEKPGENRKPLTLYEAVPNAHQKWGMSIDLTACIGCKACVVACQAENNIPVVGKEQVLAGREMHWLRVDRYIAGDFHEPLEYYFQPVPCMHCENAPCEYVCPTAATVHSADGLNDMIYQRCVGTRFCSNNCPYKVRRFNFLAYADFTTQSRQLQYNPDVTVRSRGVMEKCTYCVQRIRQAQIEAQKEDRPVYDQEVLTACQAACPTQAIVFGDIKDRDALVAKSKSSPLDYSLLGELNTVPRTTYLAALRNPNPELEPKHAG